MWVKTRGNNIFTHFLTIGHIFLVLSFGIMSYPPRHSYKKLKLKHLCGEVGEMWVKTRGNNIFTHFLTIGHIFLVLSFGIMSYPPRHSYKNLKVKHLCGYVGEMWVKTRGNNIFTNFFTISHISMVFSF